jgi:CRISPR-associated endonuclease Csn1
LTDELRQALDDPQGDDTWRHRGALFGQRRTYWNIGTLGRCDLEPTDRCVPIADRHASYFRVLETVNNIRLKGPGDDRFRPLTPTERASVINKLRSQKSGSIPAIRMALGIDKRALKKRSLSENDYKLNIAGDDDRDLNGDWFHAAVVKGAIGEDTWNTWNETQKEGLNRAILRLDSEVEEDAPKLHGIGVKLGLSEEAATALVQAWRSRPKLERRVKLSRRAIQNLLPYMEERNDDGIWRTQIEARIEFARALEKSCANEMDAAKKRRLEAIAHRYRLGGSRLTKRDRHFMKKHPDLLPPAPTLANPVVRKAIHEVRRHVIAHIRANDHKPDRIVIEFARETVKPKKVSDQIFFRNQKRERIRKRIVDDVVRPAFGDRFHQLSHNQLRAAVERVILCIQQRNVCAYSQVKLDPDNVNGACAYSGRAITLRMAALGNDLEVDHVIPYSRCGDNSLNNRVLCFRNANRNKGKNTPREWWGEKFDVNSAAMRWMADHKPDRTDCFERRDYVSKWQGFSRKDTPKEWKGSQLSDTAYAAREVQIYLQQAIWPDEPSHLEGGDRRILVTKGRYTAILRKDWQLYQKLVHGSQVSSEEMQHTVAKNRGDHREHAIDAVAIALTDADRIQELAQRARLEEDERAAAAAQGREPRRIERKPILPPWGDVKSFRRQVLSQLYEEFDHSNTKEERGPGKLMTIVCNRVTGRRLIGPLHKETLFGLVPGSTTLFTGKKRISELSPDHLRLPRRETKDEAIERIAKRLLTRGLETDARQARKAAKRVVDSPGFVGCFTDPPPEKSGLVRDLALRRVLRDEINKRLAKLAIPRDADSFTKSDLGKLLKDGPLRLPSGVPIKRVVLLRTHKDPIIIPRRAYDPVNMEKGIDPHPRSPRVYEGRSNHHIEIRENANGKWKGDIVPTYIAARRIRIDKIDAVDRSDDPARGGRFVMSLAQGDTVYMRHKETGQPGYFVVFKLDKPQTIQFKPHWDARRAKGEKNDDGQIIPNTDREEIPVPAAQLRDLAPPGEATPIKVAVDALGHVRRLEPFSAHEVAPEGLDPRVLKIAHEAKALRDGQPIAVLSRRRKDGSWRWMRERLEREGLNHLAAQLSAAFRLVQASRK